MTEFLTLLADRRYAAPSNAIVSVHALVRDSLAEVDRFDDLTVSHKRAN